MSKLEAGKLYKRKDLLACFKGFDKNENPNFEYGFNSTGFVRNIVAFGKGMFEPASTQEVESALIAEAKKRGFKEGVSANCLESKKNETCSGKQVSFAYDPRYDYMYFGGVKIYSKGKWADIIEEQPIPSMHPLIDDSKSQFVIRDRKGNETTSKYNDYDEGGTCVNVYDFIKPKQYQIGIDTFQRMEANCSVKERIVFAKGNIDKYNWRNKDQDVEDFEKIIAYAKWALKQLRK